MKKYLITIILAGLTTTAVFANGDNNTQNNQTSSQDQTQSGDTTSDSGANDTMQQDNNGTQD
jgi:hypothetical protein